MKLPDDCSNCNNHVQGNFNKEPCKSCLDSTIDPWRDNYPNWVKKGTVLCFGEEPAEVFPSLYIATKATASDGSTASYYELPEGATELQDIIAAHNMNAQMGEIGRAWMRYGRCPHSPKPRELKKIIFYAQAELERLEKYEC